MKYFSGQICDGKSSVRVFSFEPALQDEQCASQWRIRTVLYRKELERTP